MTPGRFLLLLAVVIAVLFGVSLVLMKSTADHPADPADSWVTGVKQRLRPKTRLDLERDVKSNCRQAARLVLAQNQPACVCLITNSQDRQVKELTLTLAAAAGGSFELRYEPLRQDNQTVDDGAVSVKRGIDPGKPVKLVLLPHGGTLTWQRKSGLGPATIALE